MTLSQYKARMAEMGINRENLEAGLPAENNYDKLKIRREAAHLPPWFKAVLPQVKPEADYSHLNGKSWLKCQATGRKNGRKK